MGGILSDSEIHNAVDSGDIIIDPFDPERLNPCSYDLTLGNEVVTYLGTELDVRVQPGTFSSKFDDRGFVLQPGVGYLMHTVERVHTKKYVPVLDGKALALDTEIPSPNGWTTMGALKRGDLIYTADGNVTKVLHATRTMHGRPCFRVTFTDGTSVVADAEHEWYVAPVDAKAGIRTTAKMAERYPNRLSVFKIAASAINGVVETLPIPPYTLGAWLGDGTSSNSNITFADKRIAQEIRKDGFTVEARAKKGAATTYIIGRKPRKRDSVDGTYRSDNGSFHALLGVNNLLNNKHIPSVYKTASYAQRWDLLQGLMDTDGTVHRNDQASITLTHSSLFNDVEDLCRSLGLVTYRDERPAKVNGRVVGIAYRLTWRATPELFRVPRKLTRVRRTKKWLKAARQPSRGIRSIERITSVPVRCIMVAARNGLFLATRSYIATHNSSLGRLFMKVHETAGYGDPGFNGQYTLEVTVVYPLRVYPGMRIAQMRFHTIVGEVKKLYDGNYKGETSKGPVASRAWKQFK